MDPAAMVHCLQALRMHALLPSGRNEGPAVRRTILIVDDHYFFAACLRTLLENEADLAVCDIATDSGQLLERIERLRPDLFVIDLSLGKECGLQLGRRLRALNIETPILFASTTKAPAAVELSTISRSAFIAKSSAPGEFLAALRALLTPTQGTRALETAEFSLAPITAAI